MDANLLNQPISSIAPALNIVTIDKSSTLSEAFSVLAKNNIYSAPLYDATKKEVLGFVDMMDIIIYLVGIAEEDHPESKEIPLADRDLYELIEEMTKFSTERAITVSDISRRNPLCAIAGNASIREAFKVFSNVRTHKLLVLENPWTIRSILSQTDLISWLNQVISGQTSTPQGNQLSLGPIGNKSIGELFQLDKTHHTVVSLRFNHQAIEAFKLMVHKGVSCVAITDESGGLLSAITAKDIKVLESDALFTKLYKTCSEFINYTRPTEKTVFPYIICEGSDTLQDVIHKLAFLKIHRIFIVDSHTRKPTAVISVSDIINLLAHNC